MFAYLIKTSLYYQLIVKFFWSNAVPKIYLIADLYHNHPESIGIIKQLSQKASQGEYILGLENYYWFSNFDGLCNVRGLEDPLLHYFVHSLNQLSNAASYSRIQEYLVPEYAHPKIRALIAQVSSKVIDEFKQKKTQDDLVFTKIQAFHAIKNLLRRNLFQRYLFDQRLVNLNAEIINTPLFLERYISSLRHNDNPEIYKVNMQFKMNFRDHVFLSRIKDLQDIAPNQSLVIYVGQEHLPNLRSLLCNHIRNTNYQIEVLDGNSFEEIKEQLQANELIGNQPSMQLTP